MHTRISWMVLALGSTASALSASPYYLSSGGGDGSLTVGVDGYGAFGAGAGPDASDAVYDPTGALRAAGTTFQSAVAFRIGGEGARTSLSSWEIVGGPAGASPAIAGDSTSGVSSFSIHGLQFTLHQSLVRGPAVAPYDDQLVQNYTITNQTIAPVTAELTRYLDGDLEFDHSREDFGGRTIAADGSDVLFESDARSPENGYDPTITIAAQGGITPASGRFELSSFSTLRTRLARGKPLRDWTYTQGADHAGASGIDEGYDVTLASLELLTLAPGESGLYTTTTTFSPMAQTSEPPTALAGGNVLSTSTSPGGQTGSIALPQPLAAPSALLVLSAIGTGGLWRRRRRA